MHLQVGMAHTFAQGRSQSSALRIHLSAIHLGSEVDSRLTSSKDSRKCVEWAEPWDAWRDVREWRVAACARVRALSGVMGYA